MINQFRPTKPQWEPDKIIPNTARYYWSDSFTLYGVVRNAEGKWWWFSQQTASFLLPEKLYFKSWQTAVIDLERAYQL